MSKAIHIIKKAIVYAVIVFVCFEASLWIVGYRPYSNLDYKVRSNPSASFVGHNQLGLTANPGKYEIILNDKIHFQATHLKTGERFVPKSGQVSNLKQIAFLGCSFTYGYGVDDDKSFVAVTQKRFPDYNFRNYSIPGYGSVQSYLQLQKIVKDTNTKIAILCFSDFHFSRNSMSQAYRSSLKIGFRNSGNNVDLKMKKAKFPYVSNEDFSIHWESWENLYSNYLFRNTFASVNWFQNNVDKFKDRKRNSLLVTNEVIKKMKSLCENHNIEFKIICLDSSLQTKELKLLNKGVDWLDVDFPFENEGFTNLPYDSHPNSEGHRLIARKVIPFLNQNLIVRE